ncbi:hypothetical protein [Bacillus sp. MUM 116]|uniref:hypothetical protein n=1 Tax=Bacillus sp. MUM 116 TaxID=1678002 RepID=UPI0035296C81
MYAELIITTALPKTSIIVVIASMVLVSALTCSTGFSSTIYLSSSYNGVTSFRYKSTKHTSYHGKRDYSIFKRSLLYYSFLKNVCRKTAEICL